MVPSRGKNLQFTADQEHIPASGFKFETIAFFTVVMFELSIPRYGLRHNPRRRVGACTE